jgi:hypothetical protein
VSLPARRGDRGQAAVELALGLPMVFLALLAVLQVVLVARDQLAVIHAAREGAREAAVTGDGTSAALAALGLEAGRAEVAAHTGGGRAVVTVRYRSATDVPLIGALLGDVTVQATATMLLEPPP